MYLIVDCNVIIWMVGLILVLEFIIFVRWELYIGILDNVLVVEFSFFGLYFIVKLYWVSCVI